VILYHWTAEKNLLGIAMSGLEPFAYDDDDDAARLVSAGRKVVWLTASETRTPSAADIEWIKANNTDPADREKFSKLSFGEPDDIRLTVKFNSSNIQRLKKAKPWLQQFKAVDPVTGREIVQLGDFMPPSFRAFCYVHLGVIRPSQIELPPMTARIMLLGLTPDAPQREQLAGVPPDTLIDLHAA
jgi:hypothetical protein